MKSVFVTAIVLASVVTVSGAAVAFAGVQDSSSPSTIQYSTVKTEKSTPETKKIEKISAPVVEAPAATPVPASAPVVAPAAPVVSSAPVEAAPAPAAVSAPAAFYGDPTSCPEGSTLINDIPQMPPRCSVPVPSDFVEVGRPPV